MKKQKDKINREEEKLLKEYDNSNVNQKGIMKLDSYKINFSSIIGELDIFKKKQILFYLNINKRRK